jgi:chitodextrinase
MSQAQRGKTQLRVATVFIATVLALAGCGGGGSESPPGAVANGPELDLSKTTLWINKFGQGTVASNAATLACKGQSCSATVPIGIATSFVATPAIGWALDHWTGCDVASADSCTVTATKERTVQPFFKKTAAPIIHDDVVVLSDATMAAFLGAEGAVYKFGNAASQIGSIRAGQVIVSGLGSGFARRVTNVVALTGGAYLVDTRPASLAEIVADGVVMGGKASSTQAVQTSKLGQGVKIARKSAQADGATTSLEVDLDFDDGSHIVGTVDITWNPEVAFDFGLLDGLREAKLIINPTVKPKLTVSYNGIDIEKEKLFDLGVFKLSPIYIQVGPVPVIIVPTVKGYAKFEATGGVKVELITSYALQGSYGAHYVKGVGWDGLNSNVLSGSFSPAGALNAEAQVGVGTYAAFAIYDVLGPFIQVGPYLHASGEYDPSALTSCLRFDVDLGVAAEVGGEFSLLDLAQGKVELKLIDKTLLNIYQHRSAACTDKEEPNAPVNLAAAPASASSIVLSWKDGGDNVATKSYEFFREGVLAGRSNSTGVVDSGLLPDTSYCYKLVALDAAGNRSIPSANTCTRTAALSQAVPPTPSNLTAVAASTTAMSLSWSPGAAPDSRTTYLLHMDGKPVLATNNAQAEVLKLLPSSRHCFKVAAVDRTGNQSPWSAEACATTLAPASAAWTMTLGCTDREPNIVKDIDLNLGASTVVDIADNAFDYNGTALSYHLYGGYTPASGAVTARITWTFQNSSNIRVDEFTANLATGDSGAVAMTQVQVTGCNGSIRFIKK